MRESAEARAADHAETVADIRATGATYCIALKADRVFGCASLRMCLLCPAFSILSQRPPRSHKAPILFNPSEWDDTNDSYYRSLPEGEASRIDIGALLHHGDRDLPSLESAFVWV